MTSPIVYVKDTGHRSVLVDLQSSLLQGETVTSCVLNQLVPATQTPLVISTITTTATTFSCVMTGGDEGLTYGAKFTVTVAPTRTFVVTVAVLIQTNLNVPYATHNPYAFPTLVGSIEAGDAAAAKAFFVLPSLSVADQAIYNQGYVTWSIVDNTGAVYANGNCYDYQLSPSSIMATVEANAVVNVPNDTPATIDGQRYQLRWELNVTGLPAQYAFEALQVTTPSTVPVGTTDTVELQGDLAQLSLVVEKPYANVGVQLFKGNTLLTDYTEATDKKRVSTGWFYTIGVDTTTYAASLDPYVVSWKYSNGTGQSPTRETSRMFVLNPSLTSAMEDVRMQIMKARTTLMGFEDTLFNNTTLIACLRMARDEFNGAGGFITNFDMLNATGGIRTAWLRYSMVELCRAQALAEAEKAFNFSGQAISLEVDRSAGYQSMADNLYQTLESFVPTLKKNLQIKGVTSGDGDMNNIGLGFGAMGCVGIGYSAISPAYPHSSFIR